MPEMIEIPSSPMASVYLPFLVEPEARCLRSLLGTGKWDYVLKKTRPFKIDRNPASCDDYQKCIEAGVCTTGLATSCPFGVADVSIENAERYCHWRGAQLPSFEQWQLAIRGFAVTWFEEDDLFDCRGRVGSRCSFAAQSGAIVHVQDDGKFHLEWVREQLCIDNHRVPAGALTSQLGEFGQIMFDDHGEFRCVLEDAP